MKTAHRTHPLRRIGNETPDERGAEATHRQSGGNPCRSSDFFRRGCTPSPTTRSAELLIIVALAVGGSNKAVAAGVVVGAVVLAVSMLTKYPLGVVKVLPFTVHSAGDYLAAALLRALAVRSRASTAATAG